MPLISVIIPLYNKGFIIEETLKSALNQTFKDYEIIIINDGSTDDSLQNISKFTDPRIKVFQQKNKGAASARNFGIEKAAGELIAFLDGDDYWLTNHLEEIVKLYSDFPNCGIYCSRYCMKIANNSLLKSNYGKNLKNNFRGEIIDFFEASMRSRVALTSALAIPKKLLNGNFLFNSEISSGQDLELFVKIAIDNTVAITNKETVEYNFSLENQLSKTPINQKKLLDFSQFNEKEKCNESLHIFLDLYRLEYALQYRIVGDIEKSNFFLNQINSKIPLKTRLLLTTPSFILRLLLKTKHSLKLIGVDFTVYH